MCCVLWSNQLSNVKHFLNLILSWGAGWRIRLRCRRHRFDPWVGKTPWRREWYSTPIFLPGEFHGQSSLEGYSPRGCKESDTTWWLLLSLFHLGLTSKPLCIRVRTGDSTASHHMYSELLACYDSLSFQWKVKVKSFSRVRLFATRELGPTRILRPWDIPGKGSGAGCRFLLQGSSWSRGWTRSPAL